MFLGRYIGAVAVTLSLAACGAPATEAQHRLVGPDEFATAVADEDRVTINVHVPFEGDIAGTDVSIPYDRIEAHRDRLPEDRSTPLAIYCRSGPMSADAADTLTAMGYTDVIELEGGMRAWQASGRPLVGV